MGLCTQALLALEARRVSFEKLSPISKFDYIICELDCNKIKIIKFKMRLRLWMLPNIVNFAICFIWHGSTTNNLIHCHIGHNSKREIYILFFHSFRPFVVSSKLVNFEKKFNFNHLSKGPKNDLPNMSLFYTLHLVSYHMFSMSAKFSIYLVTIFGIYFLFLC